MHDHDPIGELGKYEIAKNYLSAKIEKNSQILIDSGIFVTSDGRIDMDSFSPGCYAPSAIDHDKREVARLKAIFDQKNKLKTIGADGDLAEMFITLCLNKYLIKDFVTVRTAAYDDYKNNVDRLILDKTSGKVVCGIDDLVDNPNLFYEKMNYVTSVNNKGGANIRYGLRFEKDGSVTKTNLVKVPLLCLPCPKEVFDTIARIKNDSEFDALTKENCKFFAKFIANEINMMHLVSQFKTFHEKMKLFSENSVK